MKLLDIAIITLQHVSSLEFCSQVLNSLSGLGWVSLLSSLSRSHSHDFTVNGTRDAVLEFHVDLWDIELVSLVTGGFSNISLS